MGIARKTHRVVVLVLGLSWLLTGHPVVAEEKVSSEVLLEMVVAVVNDSVICLSDLKEEALMIAAEKETHSVGKMVWEAGFLIKVLDGLIDQKLMLEEAQQLATLLISAEEKEALFVGFRGHFSSEAAFHAFLDESGLSPTDVREKLARHLQVERVQEAKVRSIPPISDGDIRSYYQRNRARFGLNELNTVAEAIRLRLLTDQREKLWAQWIFNMRRRADVKVLVEAEVLPALLSGEPNPPRGPS